MLRFQNLRRAAVRCVLHLASGEQFALARERIDAVALQQRRDATGQFTDDRRFVRHHLCDIDSDTGRFDPERRHRVSRVDEFVGDVEQRFGRDASPVETDAAKHRFAGAVQ